MNHRPAPDPRRHAFVMVLVAAILVAGCRAAQNAALPSLTASAPSDAHGSPGPASPGPASPSPGATTAPEATVAPTPSATPMPTADGTPPPLPGDLAPLVEAVAITAGGDVKGTLGGFTMDGTGGDSPWLPFDILPAVSAAAGGAVSIRFFEDVAIGDWTAQVAAEANRDGIPTQGVAQSEGGPGQPTISVGPLPKGRWVLAVRMFRADGRGSGMSYWALTVD